jgi:hypothetical protein
MAYPEAKLNRNDNEASPLGFQVLTVVVMKSSLFWDIMAV